MPVRTVGRPTLLAHTRNPLGALGHRSQPACGVIDFSTHPQLTPKLYNLTTTLAQIQKRPPGSPRRKWSRRSSEGQVLSFSGQFDRPSFTVPFPSLLESIPPTPSSQLTIRNGFWERGGEVGGRGGRKLSH